MLIDAHCHLDFPDFDADREAVIARAKAAGVEGFVVPGTTRARWPDVLALGRRDDVTVCLGLHPYFIDQHGDDDLQALDDALAANPQVVAVGECGIDARFSESWDAQWQLFDAQVRLAKRHGLPLVIHCVHTNDRLAKRLRQLAPPHGGLIHGFAGSPSRPRPLSNSASWSGWAERSPIRVPSACSVPSPHCRMTAMCWKPIALTCRWPDTRGNATNRHMWPKCAGR